MDTYLISHNEAEPSIPGMVLFVNHYDHEEELYELGASVCLLNRNYYVECRLVVSSLVRDGRQDMIDWIYMNVIRVLSASLACGHGHATGKAIEIVLSAEAKSDKLVIRHSDKLPKLVVKLKPQA